MRRVTVNDSVVVSPEAPAQLWEACCFCQPSFMLFVVDKFSLVFFNVLKCVCVGPACAVMLSR